MTKKNDTKKQLLQSFKVFGSEASVWPPNSECGEAEPKIRIGRGYRDKDGVFRTSTYCSAAELVVQMEQWSVRKPSIRIWTHHGSWPNGMKLGKSHVLIDS